MNLRILILIISGSLSWVLTMIKSGIVYQYGMGFWGPNGHDGIWHISIANSLSQGSLKMPIFAGEALKNYHIGYDLILAITHKLTGVSLITLYFQIFPILTSLFIGILLWKLLVLWKKTNCEIFWSLFFVYFGGNFAYFIKGGESSFWSQQSVSTLINPPFAMSLVFILLGIIALEKKRYILSGVIFGLLIQVKAYASFIVMGPLLVLSIHEYLKTRQINYAKSFVVSLAVSIILFIPLSDFSASLLEFKPFWFLETMMAFPDRVGWTRFGEAMVNYKLAGNLAKGIPAYIVALLIFWYGNMGTRFIQEIYWVRDLRNRIVPNYRDLFLLLSILTGLGMSMLFVQKGTAWNTIQFFYYSQFFGAILAGFVTNKILNIYKNKHKKPYLSYLLAALTVALTLPTTYLTLTRHYLPERPPAMLSHNELEALDFLASLPQGTVLTNLFDKKLADEAVNNPPRPLYLYESTSYVSAFSGKQVFMEDEVNLDITGYDWKSRREQINRFYKHPNKEFLQDNNIKYLYLTSNSENIVNKLGLKVIFSNDEVVLLKK